MLLEPTPGNPQESDPLSTEGGPLEGDENISPETKPSKRVVKPRSENKDILETKVNNTDEESEKDSKSADETLRQNQIISDEVVPPPPKELLETQTIPDTSATENNKSGFFQRFFRREQKPDPVSQNQTTPPLEQEDPNSTGDERVSEMLEKMKTGQATKGTSMYVGDQRLLFQKYNSENTETPYVFKDFASGELISYSEDGAEKIIRADREKEDKSIADSEKLVNRAIYTSGKTLEQISRGAKALLEKSQENNTGKFLVESGKSFLNKFDPRDKEKTWYFSGMAVGAGSNVALTAFAPFLAVGPGRFVRSAAFSGVLLGVSKGMNVFRYKAMGRILSEFGIEDKGSRDSYTKEFDNAFRLLGTGNEEDYHQKMKDLSTEIFAKYGKAANKSDMESAIAGIGLEELQQKMESLSTKYKKLNNGIRSFSAGLSVGTLSITGLTGISELGPDLINKITNINLPGGNIELPNQVPAVTAPAIETPVPTIPQEIPDQTPEVPSDIDSTPAPEAVSPESQLSDILANSEYTNPIEIQQGDTVGALLSNSGYDIDWGPNNAQVFGAHIQANYDMLEQMHTNVAAAGIAVEDFPSQAEISTLVQQAQAGDPVAMHRLTETLHWIPAGGQFNVLSPEAVELVNNSQGGG